MNDNLEAVIKANDICNRYGIDTVGVGGVIAMAMECYENRLIGKTETDGIALEWGNAVSIIALTEKIAKREGFGAALADGAGTHNAIISETISNATILLIRFTPLTPFHE